jgi:lysophospholipase L1-like esterase
VAALGDSITAGSPQWDPDPAVQAQLRDRLNQQSQYEYWAQQELNGAVSIRNCGVFGERTDQIARRLDACARGAKVVVIQGGVNDLAQGRSPERAAEGLDAMVVQARALGLRPLLAQVLPWNRGYPAAAQPITRLNELIARLAARRGVPVLPFYDALEDPQRPGRMPEGLTLDDVHPNVPGYRVMGRVLAKQLRPLADAQAGR